MALFAMPAAAEPEDAVYRETFVCFVELQGSDLAVPEQLILDQTVPAAYGHQHYFSGVAETEGTGLALPRASLELSGQGLIGGDPGTSRVRCNGHAQVVYQVEIRHDVGTVGRYVPFEVASRGGVSATASDWGSLASIAATARITPEDGSPVEYETAQACNGTAFSGCNQLPDQDTLDVRFRRESWVPAGIESVAREEISISVNGYMDVFVQLYDPFAGADDRAGNASLSGWIDPQVWIDPEWEYANEYSLHFSMGVPAAPDSDGDVVPDDYDNCIEVPNSDQADADEPDDDDASLPGTQHYGDACDADLDDDGLVGPADFFGIFRPCLGADPTQSPACAEADFDGDGIVGTSDFFGTLRPRLGIPPGPGVTDP